MSAHHDVRIAAGEAQLRGAMRLPAQARGIVVFAHGSGTTRRDPVNRFVARRHARAEGARLRSERRPSLPRARRLEALAQHAERWFARYLTQK
jgi:hypothetical protein